MLFFFKPRFRQVAEDFWITKQNVYAQKTQDVAKQKILRLKNHFGHYRVNRITTLEWSRYVRAEQEKMNRNFYDCRKFMRLILTYAHEQGLIDRIPKLPIPDLPCDAGREVTPREIEKLLKCANPELRFQIRIAYKMGLRRGEILQLRWEQIDWQLRVIRLGVADTKGRYPRSPPIPDDLLSEFRRRKHRILRDVRPSAARYVFLGPSGHCPPKDNKTAWQACKKRAGVEARFHDLRHTACSRMLRSQKRHVVKKTLGMSDEMLDRYSHLNQRDIRRIRKAMAG